jgi:hypothetical protein
MSFHPNLFQFPGCYSAAAMACKREPQPKISAMQMQIKKQNIKKKASL